MNCNKIQTLLSAYVDRELTGVEMFLIRQHVHDCDACREEHAEVQRMRSILNSLEVPMPSPGFEERLVSAVMNGQPAPAEKKRIRWVSGFAAVGLSAAAALCFAYGIKGGASHLSASTVKLNALQPVPDPSNASTGVSLERDSALINASDPLAGPQIALTASYARR